MEKCWTIFVGMLTICTVSMMVVVLVLVIVAVGWYIFLAIPAGIVCYYIGKYVDSWMERIA